jgi:L-ascorbate metabolism protein UlaG (beta-lactamase superfamily)
MVDGAVAARLQDTGADRIVFLGHATVLIELGGVRLLTDPLLRGRVGHLRRQAPLPDEELFADLDAILISHLHHDHLDFASLRRIGRDTPLIVPTGAGPWIEGRGFVEVTELKVSEAAAVGALTVTAVEARHDARRPGGPHVEPVGYLVRRPPTTKDELQADKRDESGHTPRAREVYFAGDTALYPGMASLAPSLDVALVPVAGWGPKLGPGHMGPHDAAKAVALMRPKVAIPVHWGTLLPIGFGRSHRKQLHEPPRLFAEEVARLVPGIEVRILEPGRETVL